MGTFGTRAQGSTSQLQGSTVETLSKVHLVGGTDPERRSLPVSSGMGWSGHHTIIKDQQHRAGHACDPVSESLASGVHLFCGVF